VHQVLPFWAGKNVSDAEMAAESGSMKKAWAASTIGRHFRLKRWLPWPMLADTSRAKASCTSRNSLAADCAAHTTSTSFVGASDTPKSIPAFAASSSGVSATVSTSSVCGLASTPSPGAPPPPPEPSSLEPQPTPISTATSAVRVEGTRSSNRMSTMGSPAIEQSALDVNGCDYIRMFAHFS
jgi:hypothetical protein